MTLFGIEIHWLWVAAGFAVGGICGLMCAALCSAAGREDESMAATPMACGHSRAWVKQDKQGIAYCEACLINAMADPSDEELAALLSPDGLDPQYLGDC
jgi:hypothetical protein